MSRTSRRVWVDGRFCGPPGCGNGGYSIGLLARHAPVQMTTRLLRPVPLEESLRVDDTPDGGLVAFSGDIPIMQARPDPNTLGPEFEVPAAPDYEVAMLASRGYVGLHNHAFPRCFVCGPERASGDGMRIFAGSVPGRELVAAPWAPTEAVCGADGHVLPEFLAAALDCPGYFAARSDLVPMLLGEFTFHIDRRPRAGDACVLVGWRIAATGRRHQVGTALFDPSGIQIARALGTWIEPR